MAINDPHDSYFRSMMAHQIIARQLIDWVAPDFIKMNIDLESLTYLDASYVDNSLGQAFSDVVFDCRYKVSAQTKGKESWRDGKLIFLVEHQSTPERFLPIRVYNYIFNLLEKIRKNRSKKDVNKPLPVVYPIVIYNGKRKLYPFSTNLHACIDGPVEAMEYFSTKDIQLVNINQFSLEETLRHQVAGIMAEAMKNTDKNQTLDNYKAVLDGIELHSNDIPIGFTKTTVKYMMNVKAITNLKELVEQHQQLPEDIRGDIMTIADEFRDEGRFEGKVEAKTEIAMNLLKEGIAFEVVARTTGFEMAEVEKLNQQLQH